jgi:altronate hydrolase
VREQPDALFLEHLGPQARERVHYFNAQDVGDEVEEGLSAIRELAEYASQFRREPIDAAELVVGMKCGGSDGSAESRPTRWWAASRTIDRAGGTVLLSEVPECSAPSACCSSARATETRSGARSIS